MLGLPVALGTILQIAGVIGEVKPYVDAILRITQKGDNITQDELDEIVASLKARHDRIQAADPDRA